MATPKCEGHDIKRLLNATVTKKGGIQRNKEDTTIAKPLLNYLRSDRLNTMQSHNYVTHNSSEIDLRDKTP
jgi:hypothetical protein